MSAVKEPPALSPPADVARRDIRAWLAERRSQIVAPTALFVVVIAAWEAAPQIFGMSRFVLPQFSDVIATLMKPEAWAIYWPHIVTTVTEAAIGLALGIAAGLLLGFLLAEVDVLHSMFYPYIVAVQAVPKIAIAPLLVLWFGYGIASKVVIVFLLTFFPVLVNTISGVRGVQSELLELFAAHRASRLQTQFRLLLPNALPEIFAGIELAVVVSMLGAIVGEFIGAQGGLGVLLLEYQYRLNVVAVFTILIILSAIGISLSVGVRLLRRRVLFWVPGENK